MVEPRAARQAGVEDASSIEHQFFINTIITRYENACGSHASQIAVHIL